MVSRLPQLHGVDPAAAEQLITARVVLAAAASPNVPFTLAALADSTGLTEDAVQEILNSETYHQIIGQLIETQVRTMLGRGLSVMDSIVSNPETKPALRINAFRSIIAAHDSVVGKMPKIEGPNADEQIRQALSLLDQVHAKPKQLT